MSARNSKRIKPQQKSKHDIEEQYEAEKEESESVSKKDKKKSKGMKKSSNPGPMTGLSKKVKVKQVQPATYTLQAESRLLYMYRSMLELDVEKIMDIKVPLTIANGVNLSKYDKIENLDNVYKEWYHDDGIEFIEQNGLMKPTNRKITSMSNLSDFLYRVKDNYYWDNQAIIKDIHKLFQSIHLKCEDQCAYNYLAQLWLQVKPKLKPFIEQFDNIRQQDLLYQFSEGVEHKMAITKWPFVPNLQEMRSYKVIHDYEPNPNVKPFIEQIQDKLSTEKGPVICKKDCVCFRLAEMGTFSYEKITWDSECPNRFNRVECLEHEGTTESCFNQSIMHKKYTELNKDVEETYCWGIDLYTRKNILNVLQYSIDESVKQEFISQKLLMAINRQHDNGYDLGLACDYIIEKSRSTKLFNKQDRQMAKSIKRAIRYDMPKQGFRVHTKGLGLVCIKQEGLTSNQLIIPYLGEIYQPWRWYEKQDFIKKQMKDCNQKDVLPDFYNIMLDIHKNDPKGIDYLFVDPINKGNYSSRLSHSCNPNCGTVTTVSNGKYVIGMYAMKDIKFGEELTFDYCSTTESRAEYQQALCLCGQHKCKIRYLTLSNQKEYNAILEKEHCFLTRNSLLLKACLGNVPADNAVLAKYNIGSSVLSDCPQWLVFWTILILQFIDNEASLYMVELNNKYSPDTEYGKWNNLVVSQHVDERVQNLMFTIDKIRFFLLKSKSDTPPLSRIRDKELWNELWKDHNDLKQSEASIVNELYNLFTKHQLKKCLEIINKVHTKSKGLEISKQMILTRMMFLALSHQLQQSQNHFHSEALSIILYFMAFTYTYFRPYEYDGFSSIQFEDIEWRKVGAFRKKMKTETRTYSSQFVWGQLIGWFKQTVANPQASLSQDRRGTLSYPSLNSFDKSEKTYPFQPSKQSISRQFFMEHLLDKPSYMWPPELASWSYKNSYKIYGTVLFEHYYSDVLGQDFLENIITKHTDSMDNKVALMVQYEMLKLGHTEEEIMECYGVVQELIGENTLLIRETIKAPQRYKRTILSYYTEQSKRDQYFDRLRNEGKHDEAEFIQRFSSIISIDMSK